MVSDSPTAVVRANGVATSRGDGVTSTVSVFSAVAPLVSDTVTRIDTVSGSARAGFGCRYTTSPACVVPTLPTPLWLIAEETNSGSPSGSTQPGSTGTVAVPPGASSGVGHGARQRSVPHQTGASLLSSSRTVSVTVAGSEFRPSARVPSVTA